MGQRWTTNAIYKFLIVVLFAQFSLGAIFSSTVPSTVQKLRILLPFAHSFNKDSVLGALGSVLGAGNTLIYIAKIFL